jgi:hypothetical protein
VTVEAFPSSPSHQMLPRIVTSFLDLSNQFIEANNGPGPRTALAYVPLVVVGCLGLGFGALTILAGALTRDFSFLLLSSVAAFIV